MVEVVVVEQERSLVQGIKDVVLIPAMEQGVS
jgi:hypothetical protein